MEKRKGNDKLMNRNSEMAVTEGKVRAGKEGGEKEKGGEKRVKK